KSTIFNRLVGERISIVEDKPGVTRDRIYAEAEWLNHKFDVIDTGGIEIGDEPLLQQMRYQAEIAIDEADVIIFLLNAKENITAADEEVAKLLFKSSKTVVLGVNKMDNPKMREEIYEYYAIGFGEPYPISGSHGLGLGDLLDKVVEHFLVKDMNEAVEVIINFCIIVRSNVCDSAIFIDHQ